MQKLKWSGFAVAVAGLGIALATACGATDDAARDSDKSPGEQELRFVASPGNGGVVTIAGTGIPGSTGHANAAQGTLNEPAGVAVVPDAQNPLKYTSA